jgi:hypothetical protein
MPPAKLGMVAFMLQNKTKIRSIYITPNQKCWRDTLQTLSISTALDPSLLNERADILNEALSAVNTDHATKRRSQRTVQAHFAHDPH